MLTNYLRPANMPILLAALESQTVDHRLFVWDNSPDQAFECARADWVIHSSRNAKCGARWWLAAHADTPWVLLMDDDLAPADDHVLADTLTELAEHQPTAVGAAGVVLDPAKSYFECRHVGLGCRRINATTRVDILKGRYFAVTTQRLEQLHHMPLDCEDDIIASAALGGGIVPARLEHRFRELATGFEARFHRPEHSRAREDARRRWLGADRALLQREGAP